MIRAGWISILQWFQRNSGSIIGLFIHFLSQAQLHQSSPFFNPQQDPGQPKEPKPAESVETEPEAPEPTEVPEAVPEATEEVNVEPKDEGAASVFLGKTTPWIWGKLAVCCFFFWVKAG